MSKTMEGSGDLFAVLAQDHARFEERLQMLMHAADTLNHDETDGAARDVVRGTLDFFATAGARHEAIEEAMLFPRLRPLPEFTQMLSALDFQHRMNRAEAEKLRACIDRFGPGGGRELRRLAHRFSEMHRAHALGEERALFPRATAALSAAAIEAMSREARQWQAAAERTEENPR